MLNHLVEKVRERDHSLGPAFPVWPDSERTQARKNFVEALDLPTISRIAGIKHISPRRPPDGASGT